MSQKRLAVPDDLLGLHPIGEPCFSPDGAQVAYVLQTLDAEQDAVHSDIWVVPVAVGAPRRLTREGRNQMPRWSPDGSQIAYLSNVGGRSSIWLVFADGGEVRRIETEQQPLTGLAWSPDGRSLSFVARVFSMPESWETYPGAPAGDSRRAGAQAVGETTHGDVKVISRLNHKLDGIGYFNDGNLQVFTVPAEPGPAVARQVTSGPYDHTDPAWSPDGQCLICVADRSGVESERDSVWSARSIWSIEVKTGAMQRLTGVNGPVMAPAFSADGKRIAFFGHEVSFGPATFPRLWIWQDGVPVCVTADLDRYIGTPAYADTRYSHGIAPLWPRWSADGQQVYVQIGVGGDCPIFAVPISGAEVRQVAGGQGRTVAAFDLRADGSLAMIAGDTGTPDELYFVDGTTGAERALTRHNGEIVAEVSFGRGERILFKGADDWEIEGWLYKPDTFRVGEPVPLVLIIHGGPHYAFGEILNHEAQILLGIGCAVLNINPRGSGGYSQAFSNGCMDDWGGKDFADLMAGVDYAVKIGVADPERLGIMGWSYGGYMSSWAITQTDRFRAALIGACVSNRFSFAGTSDVPWFMTNSAGGEPWQPAGVERLLERSAIRGISRITTPALIVHPEGDLRCPIEQSEQLFTNLRRQGKEAYLVRYPGEFHIMVKPGHRLDYYRRITAWFRHRLIEA